jgi:hypothetical protein
MSACGFDADLVASALGGELPADASERALSHLAGCRACRESAAVHERARHAWRASIDLDDACARDRRERRLMNGRPKRRPRVSAFLQVAASAALGGMVVALWLGPHRAPRGSEEASRATAPPVTVSEAPRPRVVAPTLPAIAPPTAAPTTNAAPTQLVMTRTCATCRGPEPTLGAGATLPAAPVDVPSGATLVLGWAMGQGAVEAGKGIDVIGPARVRALDGPALFVERGAAVADATRGAEVRSAFVRTRGTDASWRIDVSGDRTRVEVLRGEVVLEAGGAPARTLRAGDRVDLAKPPPKPTITAAVTAPPVPPAPSVHPREALDAALARLAAGDDDAFRRLDALIVGADEDVAFEAATAAARGARKNAERAVIWRRYLQRSRPAPHADVAMATLANVLFDIGASVEARVVVEAATARPSVPEAAALLDRARGRLAASSAEECLDHDVRKLPPARKKR